MNGLFHEPPDNCALCPRLHDYRQALKISCPTYVNRPVPAFGSFDCKLLIVGLAPGKSGANRTGRPFTGDYAGDLLYATLLKFGLANGSYGAHREDGLQLIDTRITNAIRCVPPGNRPEPAELRTCRQYLRAELGTLPRLRGLLALGRVAHDQILAALSLRKAAFPFQHGAQHRLPAGQLLADSYHCSRYNTNTGRLTVEMFEAVIQRLCSAVQAV